MDVCDETVVTSECSASDSKSFSNTNKEGDGSASTTTSSHIPHLMLHGCDNSNSSTLGGNSMSPQTSTSVNDSDGNLDQLPCPKHISEQELNVLQVATFDNKEYLNINLKQP
jgi:hypothetical protein